MAGTRKIAAILVADIVGYSRLAGTDENRTLARLRGLRSDLIDPAIDAHHGRIVKRTGDGSIIEFRSVVDAVRCAIEVQTGMVERNAGLPPERRIEFRVGIHLGDVVEETDGDLMGDGVNIAARVEGIARPGAICLSEDAYRQVSNRLDMAVANLGPTQLKNIERPIRVYSLQIGVPAVAKPATAAKAPEPKKRSRFPLLAAAIAALIALAAGSGYFLYANRNLAGASNVTGSPGTANLSIVVKPFANLSGDPAQDYLADALTDELTTGLARLRDSFVIARNTAFTYKGKPVEAQAIGKELGVRYVLEGSVQPSGNRVRVNADLIDADSGARVWAEQFDTARADLLQMQDDIVNHLARAMFYQLPELEAARLKRAPAANPDAEDLALQCQAAAQKGGYLGKEAEAGYRLCEQALAIDPNNALALGYLAVKFAYPVVFGLSADPKADLKRGDELNAQALAVDPNSAGLHQFRGIVVLLQGRIDESIAESERALALDPSRVDAMALLGADSARLGQFETAIKHVDRAIRLSPDDPALFNFYEMKSGFYFGLKQYDQAIDSARRSIAIRPDFHLAHGDLIAALAFAGHEAEAQEALRRYLALPTTGFKTIASWEAYRAQIAGPQTDPRYHELWDRMIEGLRKVGMPEETLAEAKNLSIVVLPFANLSGDPAQEYLADALTDELTTAIARVRDSFVIARDTALTYKGKPVDAKAIGKDLSVRYVLEGSVQPSGNQVRVNAKLIDADNGAQLWAEQFDTARADLLQMQDEIVTHLARAVNIQLPEVEGTRLKRTPAANPDAEDLALQCTATAQKGGWVGKEAEAGYRLCQQALAIDPNNVRALGILTQKYLWPAVLGNSADPKADFGRADELTSQALALDPNWAALHLNKANILHVQRSLRRSDR
jgi:adenylate cyclase